MQEIFNYNLAKVLAFSVVYETNKQYPFCSTIINGGDPVAPSAQETTGQMMEAFIKYLPSLIKVSGEQVAPSERALLAANKEIQPEYSKLDLSQLKGPGGDVLKEVLSKLKEQEPEFFKSRADISENLSKLFQSIDPTGKLSPTELAEIERATNRGNFDRGITTPSASSTLSNAVNFGQAAQARKSQAQGTLTNAIGAGTSFLPVSKTGVDPFQVITGKPALGGMSSGLGNNLLQQTGQFAAQKNQIDSQRRDTLDRFNETWGTVIGSC